MKRDIDIVLEEWSQKPVKKVLLLRGARQVGKTYSIRKLGQSFDNFLEINFEMDEIAHQFFDDSLEAKSICGKLSAYYGKRIIPRQTLLFFDEVQACTKALRSLRFFQEQMPELHVVAAGSLLEFAIKEIPSFGVGRITSRFLFPLSFYEFLQATGNELLQEEIKAASPSNPLNNALHKKAIEQYRLYQILGGMPAVVDAYVNRGDFLECRGLLDDLILGLRDDFGKYGGKSDATKLFETFESVASQAGKKFKYSRISQEFPGKVYKTSLELLCLAGLVYKVNHSSCNGPPLGGEIDIKKFKALCFDVGIYQRMSGSKLSELISMNSIDMINKGSCAEVFVGNELVKHSMASIYPRLFYWHREAKSSNAEIDYVFQKSNTIIPVEVKAGTKGQMQSMFIFLKEKRLNCGIRLSMENFGEFGDIKIYPLYAVQNLFQDGD
ncbi:ATP-binding protein [Fibrobacterota bacterium]